MVTHTVGDELKAAVVRLAAAGVDSPLLDAQLLMAYVADVSRLDIIAHPERLMTETEHERFAELISQRASRYPLAYILGHREFYGLDFIVGPGVLIPRPETEVLVAESLKRLQGNKSPVVADIGAGSGAIAVSLAANMGECRIFTTEISPDAAKVARANIAKHEVSDRVTLLEGNLTAPLLNLGLRFDAIVSNPPYITTSHIAELEPEVGVHEPALALDGGPDGLDAYRRLLPEAASLLADDGFVAVEIGFGEAEDVVRIARNAGFTLLEVVNDLAGIERVVVASR